MGITLVKSKLFSQRIPLVVAWALTYRCNSRCKYCTVNDIKVRELTTSQIYSIIDDLARWGTKRILFTGGEPLLREDIGKIVDYSKGKGLYVSINTNGVLIPKKLNEIEKLDSITLSFDGPEKQHDMLRGDGNYNKLMEAIRFIGKTNINMTFCTVLSKYNLQYIDFILEKAKKFGAGVYFQPVNHLRLKDLKDLLPEPAKYKQTILKLIKLKEKRNKYILNSISGLNHLYKWPDKQKISCCASKIYCRILPDGGLYSCTNLQGVKESKDCINLGFKGAFDNLLPVSCGSCWCATMVELNLLYSFNTNAIFNIIKSK